MGPTGKKRWNSYKKRDLKKESFLFFLYIQKVLSKVRLMKFFTITTGLIGMAITLVHAADVTYSVVAFPGANENVAVSVANQDFPLQRSPQHANLFTGTAPFGAEYRYTVLTAEGSKPENTTRHLADTTTNTGNEFFGRSKTLYDVPALPRAFNPIYPRKIISRLTYEFCRVITLYFVL